jgi:hypothetical protein
MIDRLEYAPSRPQLHKHDHYTNQQIRSVSQAPTKISIPLQLGHHEDVKPRLKDGREPVNLVQPTRDPQGSVIKQNRQNGITRQMIAKANVIKRANSTRSTTGHAITLISPPYSTSGPEEWSENDRGSK